MITLNVLSLCMCWAECVSSDADPRLHLPLASSGYPMAHPTHTATQPASVSLAITTQILLCHKSVSSATQI